MEESPFSAPKSDVEMGDIAKGSPVKAVLFGVLADIGSTLVAGLMIGVVYGIILASAGVPMEQLEQAMQYSPIGLISLLVGLLCSVLGGYVCARIANHNEYRLAAITGFISMMIGLLFFADDSIKLGESIFLSGLSFVMVVVGAHLYVIAKRGRHDASSPG